jgi:hypothetical protein
MGLKSPSDGRWDGRGRTGLRRALAQRRRRTPSSGRCDRDLAYGDQPLCRWDVDLDGQDVTMASWTFSGANGSVLGLLGTHSRLQEPPGSQRLAYWMMVLP